MDYGLKYELLCTTRKGNLYKAKVYFDGYTGDDIDRNFPVSPFKLRKDKAAVVRGTTFELSIREEVDFEFLEFYTNNNKKIKVELYDPSNNLIWVGYNLPQQYQVPYVPPPASVTFTATDGLGILKNESFTLTGRNSQLDTIRHCIDKIGLDLGYSIAINLFEITHNHSYTPLAQTYVDADIFAGLNCYEVLEKVLGPTNEITQVRAQWAITCSADKKSTRMLYTSGGIYNTTEAAPAVLDLGQLGESGVEVYPRGSLQMGLEPGGKEVKITHDFGRKDSLLLNYNFIRYASSEFPGWTKTGTFDVLQGSYDGKKLAILDSYSNTDDYITQSIDITNVAEQSFVFSLKFAPLGKYENIWVSGSNIFPVAMDVRLHVYISDGTDTWYLTKQGWLKYTGDLQHITLSVNSSIGNPVFNELKIITHEIPISGTLYVRLYRYKHGTPDSGIIYRGVIFADVCAYFMNEDELYPASLSTLAVFNGSTEVGDLKDVAVFAADAPAFANNALLYDKITRVASGASTTLWHRLGSASTYSLIIQLAMILASDNRVARQKLTGDIKGTGIAFDSIIRHTYNGNREFEISEGTWDIYEETFNVTLLELLVWSDETITFTNESSQESSSGGISGGAIMGMMLGNNFGSDLNQYFEVVNAGETDEYLRCKLPLACDYDIAAYSTFEGFPNSIWEDMPIASATVKGAIKVGTGLTIDVNGVLNADAGEPGAGAWGSITGDIYDQTDLQTALGTKATTIHNLIDTTNHPVTGLTTGHFLKALSATTYGFAAHGLTYASVGACSTSDSRLSDARPASDVYAWAKAATKPSYSYSEVGALAAGGTAVDSAKLNGQSASYYQTALTFGIANTNKVQINAADVADNDYAKFTASGLEGRSYAEVLSDIGAAAVAQTMYIGTTAVAINRASGTMALAGITTLSVVTVNATGEVTAYYTSDERLKQNITPFTALNLIEQMNPVTFKWNEKGRELNPVKDGRTNYGLIAQDIEHLLPELVHPVYDEYKSIDYIQLVPVLIQAINEQQKQISNLKEDLIYFKNYNT